MYFVLIICLIFQCYFNRILNILMLFQPYIKNNINVHSDADLTDCLWDNYCGFYP